ncbi:S1 family peptidase [Pseudoxanthomonas mexicana]
MRKLGLASALLLIISASSNAQVAYNHAPPFTGNISIPLSQVVKRYRNSVVFLEIEVTNKSNGAITEARGTGFILSPSGHVITAGHLFDALEGTDGTALIFGRVGSRFAAGREELELLRTSKTPDGALLKFRNTGLPRMAIPLGNPDNQDDGAPLYVMGFPGTEEWFQDEGRLTGRGGPLGSWSTTISFEPGISGAPVLNNMGQVVAVAWGGVPNSTGGLNRVLPVNLYSSEISAAGVPMNTEPPLSSQSPIEQLARRRREGIPLVEGAPAFPMFSDGVSSLLVSSQGESVVVSVRAPEHVHASLRALPDQARPTQGGEERSYGLTSGDNPCVQVRMSIDAFSQCGQINTSATVRVIRESTNQGQFITATWRIPMAELGGVNRTASIAVAFSTGSIITNGYHRIVW